MKKVTLFFPTPFPYNRPYHGTPLALLAISRILAHEGYDVRIIARHLFADVEKEVLTHAKDSICVGISAMTGFQINDGLAISRLVRQHCPDVPIVWGGWHPSIRAEETTRDPNVDIVVRGYGDHAFPAVVKALESGGDLGAIPNLVYRKGDQIVQTPDAFLGNLEDLPPIPYHLVDLEKCMWETEMGRRTIAHISSYGCPHRCGFCVEPIVNRRRWKAFPAERVVDEWEYLARKHNCDSVAVIDSNFFVDKRRAYDIATGLLKRNLKIKWGSANGRVPQLVKFEPEIWEALEKSGCTTILTGSESGSQEALDMINKDMDVDEIGKFTELAAKYHIKVFFSFLVGLPWSANADENRRYVAKEYSSTLGLIGKLLKITNRNRFMYYMFLPYPGAPLYDRAVELGLRAPDSLEGWSNHLLSPNDGFNIVTKQKWITPTQARMTAMLTQYIFGLLDPDTYDTLKKTVSPGIKRLLFTIAYKIGEAMAKLRWRFQFFAFPIDYWVFTQIYKYGKIV
ncbi:MAG: B12-binding domain-containing radical SAM protein [Verrucomicrobia bacterium]|nr:B12-binding domain-containing radical SAM protein [Verrucomicrobiota bacterium]